MNIAPLTVATMLLHKKAKARREQQEKERLESIKKQQEEKEKLLNDIYDNFEI